MKVTLDNKKLFEFTTAKHKEIHTFGKRFVDHIKELRRSGQPIGIETRINEYAEGTALEIERTATSLKMGKVKTIKHAIFNSVARLDKDADMILYGFAQSEENGDYIPTIGICYQEDNEMVRALKDYIVKELEIK